MGDIYRPIRRTVASHIKEWLDSVPVGTEATIAEICQFRSQEYGDDMPSPGAVAARLFPANGGGPRLDFGGFEAFPPDRYGAPPRRGYVRKTGPTTEPKVKYVPIGKFPFPEPGPNMFTLTCVNHPTARYSTKNPFERSLHIWKLPEGDIERTNTGECICPISDLVVIVNGDEEEGEAGAER